MYDCAMQPRAPAAPRQAIAADSDSDFCDMPAVRNYRSNRTVAVPVQDIVEPVANQFAQAISDHESSSSRSLTSSSDGSDDDDDDDDDDVETLAGVPEDGAAHVVDELVAPQSQPLTFIDQAYRNRGLVDVDHSLRWSSDLDAPSVGSVEFLHGASFSLKVHCSDPSHIPEANFGPRTERGRKCFFIVNCTHDFRNKLCAGLDWLVESSRPGGISRDEHIQHAIAAKNSFAS